MLSITNSNKKVIINLIKTSGYTEQEQLRLINLILQN